MRKYYLILVFVCVVFSACTSIFQKDVLYVQMETAIRKFINKNRDPSGYQTAAFAYKEESLKGGIKKLKSGKIRVFIGQWEISPLPKKGYYTAFIGKRISDNVGFFEDHTLRLKLKQNKDSSFKVISSLPVKKWGKLNRQEAISQLIANFRKSNNKDYKISVIRTLGKLRAIEAIPFLIRNIRYEEGENHFYTRKLTYAGKALSKIGSPCIIPILYTIPEISNSLYVEQLINVLIDINNHDLTIAHLQNKIEETKGLREKQLFERILQRAIRHKKKKLSPKKAKTKKASTEITTKDTQKIKKYVPQAGDKVIVTGVFRVTKGYMGIVKNILIPKFLNRVETAFKYRGKWVRVIGTLSKPSYPEGKLVQRGPGLELELESIEIVISQGVKKEKIEKASGLRSFINNDKEGNNIYVTLKGKLHSSTAPVPYLMSHPLVCIKGGDYSDGSEMILVKQLKPLQMVHVVFPNKTNAPKIFKKQIILHGYFQEIKNKKIYTRKKVYNHKYFVVRSWEYKK